MVLSAVLLRVAKYHTDKTLDTNASFTYTKAISNAIVSNYKPDVDKMENVVHYLPHIKKEKSHLSNLLSDDTFLVLLMPKGLFLDTRTLCEIHGSLLMETSLEVYFHKSLPHSADGEVKPAVELDTWHYNKDKQLGF